MVVNEYQLRYYVYFQINTLGKGIKTFYPPAGAAVGVMASKLD